MKRVLLPFKGLIVFISILGCQESPTTTTSIPDVQVECDGSTYSECGLALDGRLVTVVMTRSGCGSSADFESIATGSSRLSCTFTGCQSEVSSWTNPDNSESVSEILTGTMDICSRITVSGDDSESSDDLISEESVNITGSSDLAIREWEDV